jgi:hypothetical protein
LRKLRTPLEDAKEKFCLFCGAEGHYAYECPNATREERARY